MSTDTEPGTGTGTGTEPRQSAAARTTPPAPNFWASVWLVATREIVSRLRSKAFLISTGILLLIAVGSVVAGGIMSANPSTTSVAVVGSAGSVVGEAAGLTMVPADGVAEAEALVRDGTVEAAVVPDDSLLGVSVIALDSPPSAVMNALSVSPAVELLDPAEQGGFLVYIVALGFGLVFFMSALTFGSTIAQSVVEEKQTRVVEILMSAIPVRALLAGKVVGNSIMALGQIVAIALLVGIGMAVTGQRVLLADLGPAIGWFAVFFAFGFVMIAALFAATASMVSRQEDVGSTTAPVTYLVMIPYFLVIFFNDNPLVMAIMSYVPFSAPVGMPVRIFLGSAEWWEPVLALIILAVTTAGVIILGSRIYRNSLLRMGGRVTIKQALRG
ncbi:MULTISPECIES: ABC transporter permease [Cryobacterium]|uniref:Sodium ABC transporter permease n=1 Tax=Cryobacterium zongtaii TaxID=1259217 RepID=A0A2S3ZHW5_9MICO|nr:MULTISPECIES: ABC transporter permease [Cryobacterium]POH63528.1 sodium ABC transporter permease [Cryobacterium zongtaii]POH66724.1 sodium ABC transporter permease [Cryobacterium zongtaii]TFC42134.1 ABC transporter permease [Cryobacterium sp. TMN-39-2]